MTFVSLAVFIWNLKRLINLFTIINTNLCVDTITFALNDKISHSLPKIQIYSGFLYETKMMYSMFMSLPIILRLKEPKVVVTSHRYEFRQLSKWKIIQVFTRDRNETKAIFLQIFLTVFRLFVNSHKVMFFLFVALTVVLREISRFHEENFVPVRVQTCLNYLFLVSHQKWAIPVRVSFSSRSHVN